MGRRRCQIAGTGSAVPATVLPSARIEESLGLEPGWIAARTGVRERRVAGPEEATSDLAVAAGAMALQRAGIDPGAVRLLLLATSTPDHPLPATAPQVAHRLGLRAAAFDLAAACSGFLYGLELADRWLRADGAADPGAALVIGANVLSRRVNWRDRNTAALFGDGAGAVVLRLGEAAETGLLTTWLTADGSRWQRVYIPAGGSRQPLTAEALAEGLHLMQMERGPDLFREAVRMLADAARAALKQCELRTADVDHFIPHQANARLIAEAARLLGIAPERTVVNVDRYGNTSAASIPLVLHEAALTARLRPGDLVLLAAVGSGMTAGAAVLRWGEGI